MFAMNLSVLCSGCEYTDLASGIQGLWMMVNLYNATMSTVKLTNLRNTMNLLVNHGQDLRGHDEMRKCKNKKKKQEKEKEKKSHNKFRCLNIEQS